MEKAKENYKLGKEKVVTSEEMKKKYTSGVGLNERRFLCLECGEYVTFVRRQNESEKYKSYFMHGSAKQTTVACKLRSEGQSLSIYERTGLPLFLKRCAERKFELYVGFYGLGATNLNMAEKAEIQVFITSIKKDKKEYSVYYINNQNFFENAISLKRLTFISHKYNLQYRSITSAEIGQKLTNDRWGNQFEGISDNGALFTHGENGGRKLHVNDEITLGQEYLYVCLNESLLFALTGLEYYMEGELFLESDIGNSTYKVYRIMFKACSDKNFRKLYDFCREYLKLSLINNPSTLTPIWPPAIQVDNYLSYFKRGESLHLLRSEESNQVIVYKEEKREEYEGSRLVDQNYLIRVPVSEEEQVMKVDGRGSIVGSFLKVHKGELETYENSCWFKDIDGNCILEGTHFKLPVKKTLKVFSKAKFTLLHFKNGQLYASHEANNANGITIVNIAFGDEIRAVFSSVDNRSLIKYTCVHSNHERLFDDAKVYSLLLKFGAPYVSPPVWTKSLLAILDKNTKTYKAVRNFLYMNRISRDAIKTLYREYSLLTGGLRRD